MFGYLNTQLVSFSQPLIDCKALLRFFLLQHSSCLPKAPLECSSLYAWFDYDNQEKPHEPSANISCEWTSPHPLAPARECYSLIRDLRLHRPVFMCLGYSLDEEIPCNKHGTLNGVARLHIEVRCDGFMNLDLLKNNSVYCECTILVEPLPYRNIVDVAR